MSNAEEGIARTQLKGDKAVEKHQRWGIAYLDDRIFVYLSILAFLGLIVVWLTASSPLILYGSFGLAILTTLFWGYARIKRIESTQAERIRQVESMRSSNDEQKAGGN